MRIPISVLTQMGRAKTLNLIRDETDQKKASLYIYGDIVSEEWYESDVTPQKVKDELGQLGDITDLDIYINSGGGDVWSGMAIINILDRLDCKKVAHIDGVAASMASVIACACDEVIVPANAQMMIHKPSAFAIGNADDLRSVADQLDATEEQLVDIYMKHSLKDRDEIKQAIQDETWIYGEEAQDFFDHVNIDHQAEIKDCASNYFDSYKTNPTENRLRHERDLALAKLEAAKGEVN